MRIETVNESGELVVVVPMEFEEPADTLAVAIALSPFNPENR